jgi:hypothetical protein
MNRWVEALVPDLANEPDAEEYAAHLEYWAVMEAPQPGARGQPGCAGPRMVSRKHPRGSLTVAFALSMPTGASGNETNDWP